MYLKDCPENNYFIVEELWFHYNERIDFENKGLVEGTKIFVSSNTEDHVIVETEMMTISLNYEQANNVYGKVYIKHKQKTKKRKRR